MPGQDRYIPDVAGATAFDYELARTIQRAVLDFCASHPTPAQLQKSGYVQNNERHWYGGTSRMGFEIFDPKTALVENGRTFGVMFIGGAEGFPYLGSIPRPHVHAHRANGRQMLHVYCSEDLRVAFAPQRPDQRSPLAPAPAENGPREVGGPPNGEVPEDMAGVPLVDMEEFEEQWGSGSSEPQTTSEPAGSEPAAEPAGAEPAPAGAEPAPAGSEAAPGGSEPASSEGHGH